MARLFELPPERLELSSDVEAVDGAAGGGELRFHLLGVRVERFE